MIQANNTGHDGGFSTIHANSPRDALSRLETMVLMADSGLPLVAIRRQIAAAFDLIVHMVRLPNGARRIAAIVEVAGCSGDEIAVQELFRYDRALDRLEYRGAWPDRLARRWQWAGIEPPLPQPEGPGAVGDPQVRGDGHGR